jgi:type IV pilus assembly protein PilE
MERYYTTHLSYTGATLPTCSSDVTPHYTISFSAGPAATSYTLQMAPNSPQSTDDANCGTLSVDNFGTKGASGSGGVAECW